MFTKKYYLIIDVETANDTTDSLVYDLGYAVIDRKATIYEKGSLIVRDIFTYEKDLMNTCYYAKKLPLYYSNIHNGQSRLVSFYEAKSIIKKAMTDYNITTVLAYNSRFDLNALNTTQRWLTKSKYRYFFPYGTEVQCIWHMACQTLCSQKTFIKWAIENGFVSPSGNIQTSAEVVKRYISGDTDFEEAHQGLKDVEIEAEIFAYVMRQHKKVNPKINPSCWQIPQKVKEEMGL